MELNGALLNRRRLSDANLLAHALATRPGPKTQSRSQIRPRAGAIQEAVNRVLAAADQPLRAREIHAAAQKLAGTPISWNTVKDCLHKNARRPDSPIKRVAHGWYRHLSESVGAAQIVDSPDGDLSCLREGASGGVSVLPVLRGAVVCALDGCCEGAEGGVGVVL